MQKPGKDGEPAFLKKDLFPKLVSQTHAMHFVDINGDGLKDLVTGKRYGRTAEGRRRPGAGRALLVRGQEERGRHHHLRRRT